MIWRDSTISSLPCLGRVSDPTRSSREAISSIQEGDWPDIECTAHDFFTPQPARGAKANYMHSVLHD